VLTDTHPDAEALQIELLRTSPTWRKLRMVGQLNQTVRLLVLAGLRSRHPHETPEQLRRRLADLVLGAELAARVCGSQAGEGEEAMLPEPIAVTLEVTDVLEALGIPYVIGGSLASAVHGVVRSTLDADIIADLRMEHAPSLGRMLGDSFYVDVSAIESAILRKDSFNAVHKTTFFKVDVFVSPGRAFEASRFSRRKLQVVDTNPERRLFVSSAEDTILAKLESYRRGQEISERQWSDVLGILKVQGNALDREYLHHWASELNVRELLDKALKESGLD